jgi:beta-glucanase (GH16 family)
MTTTRLRLVSPCLLPLLLLLLLSSNPTYADWVDPDTPWEARTTAPLNVKPPPRPPPSPEKSKHHHHHHYHHPKTHVPTITPAPTASRTPSASPSGTPTQYPTFTPKTFELVFSDEFNMAGRAFTDGADPRWTALDKNDYTNDALHYYTPENVATKDGHLVITTEAADTDIIGFNDVKGKKEHVSKHFRSAMVQSWNKFCFTGGIIEAEVIMPGKGDTSGLWPAFWLLGNLARHTYVGSANHMWPWASTTCTATSFDAQAISGCDRVEHYGMEAGVGRGSPEMDIFEVQPGSAKGNTGNFLKSPVGQPFMSNSYQVAPGRPGNRPGPGEWPGPGQWYNGLIGGANATVNIMFYGAYNHFISGFKKDYWSDAISYNRQLTTEHFTKPSVYRLEWDVPSNTTDGYLHWFLDNELVFALDGKGLTAAGLGSAISSEPSYILMNTAVSKQWGFPLDCDGACKCKEFDCHATDWQSICAFPAGFCDMMKKETGPPEYKINWVRVYQDPDNPTQKVGCSTPERPTRRYIEAHADLYKTEYDKAPLKTVPRGSGKCDTMAVGMVPAACGGIERGTCHKGKCTCQSGWTGPNCLSHDGWNPVAYDEPDRITDVGFVPPRIAPKTLMGGLVCLLLLLLVMVVHRRRARYYSSLPDGGAVVASPRPSKMGYTQNSYQRGH